MGGRKWDGWRHSVGKRRKERGKDLREAVKEG